MKPSSQTSTNTSIKAKNFQLSNQTRNHINKRLDKIYRFLHNPQEVRVDLTREQTKSQADRFVVQITVRAERKILRAEERNQDILTAFDHSLDKLNHQIARLKGKKLNRWHAPESIRHLDDMPPLSDDMLNALTAENQRSIVRVKQFSVTPMNEAEALEQMQLLAHDFFVFFNAELGRINVLYKRDDEDYGLLDPIID